MLNRILVLTSRQFLDYNSLFRAHLLSTFFLVLKLTFFPFVLLTCRPRRQSCPYFGGSQSELRIENSWNTAVGGSRAGGSKANFGIFRKIMSEALKPIWIFQKKTCQFTHTFIFLVFQHYEALNLPIQFRKKLPLVLYICRKSTILVYYLRYVYD